MNKKTFYVLIFILIISILTNIVELLVIMDIIQENVAQYKEIRQLEYELEYVCDLLDDT